jgi:single-strand DNA-binding protein
MQGVNKVILIGRLGQDPEVRATPSGQSVATLRVATSESWVKDGQREERTEWHRVIVWGRQAETVGKYLTKGRAIFVEGKIQTRSWDDAQSGQKRFMTEIVANNIQFLDSGARAAESGYGAQRDGQAQGGHDDFGYGQGMAGGAAGGAAMGSGSEAAGDFGALDDDVPF